MPRDFCTLFNSVYLSRGVVMCESLLDKMPGARIHVLAMDDSCANALDSMSLPNVRVIRLAEFETPELLAVKPGRTVAEYCWTCTPALLHHLIFRENLAECTYVDADLGFFDSPERTMREMGQASILLTPHWYSPNRDQCAISGIFCVQFLTFRSSAEGKLALSWWLEGCLEWCFARPEPGRFGDQKYLDDWPDRFAGVHVARHRGLGVAPWNVEQYEVGINSQGPTISIPQTGEQFQVLFFHYHGLQLWSRNSVCLTGRYRIGQAARSFLYKDYVSKLLATEERIAPLIPTGDSRGRGSRFGGWRDLVRTSYHRLGPNTISTRRLMAA